MPRATARGDSHFIPQSAISFLLAIACFTVSPAAGGAALDRVELVELNHVYDEHGESILDQLIFYDWSEASSRYEVIAWRLVKSPWSRPLRDFRRGGLVAVFRDGERLREVRCRSFRESWTQYDVELHARGRLKPQYRRGLSFERNIDSSHLP